MLLVDGENERGSVFVPAETEAVLAAGEFARVMEVVAVDAVGERRELTEVDEEVL